MPEVPTKANTNRWLKYVVGLLFFLVAFFAVKAFIPEGTDKSNESNASNDTYMQATDRSYRSADSILDTPADTETELESVNIEPGNGSGPVTTNKILPAKTPPSQKEARNKSQEKIKKVSEAESKPEETSKATRVDEDKVVASDVELAAEKEERTEANETQKTTDPKETEEKPAAIGLTIPSQYITAEIMEDISSDKVKAGSTVYLKCLDEIKMGPHIVVRKGARVRALIDDARPSYNGGRALLSLKLEAVETTDGQWLELQYPLYSDKKKREIIFRKGSKIPKLKLKSTSINFQIPSQ
jgi:hypothetical protein